MTDVHRNTVEKHQNIEHRAGFCLLNAELLHTYESDLSVQCSQCSFIHHQQFHFHVSGQLVLVELVEDGPIRDI
ncbi:hypothetical protein M514_09393 [Trichuris suis]|uniref:Uncharacterized protein n=1 Tax=Trichuris suis TaxID=68888 RepID=A0A085LXK0_9BILA|nr:hypothetical protein M513_09393 [Trichuris suis]KFD62043.1 hypothetical protein M514_09393 [Trichuris suis]